MAEEEVFWFLGPPAQIDPAGMAIAQLPNITAPFDAKLLQKLRELCEDDATKPFMVMNGFQFHLEFPHQIQAPCSGIPIDVLNMSGFILRQTDLSDTLRHRGHRKEVTGGCQLQRFHDYNINYMILLKCLPPVVIRIFNLSPDGRPLPNLCWAALHVIECYSVALGILPPNPSRPLPADTRTPTGNAIRPTLDRQRRLEYTAHHALKQRVSPSAIDKARTCVGEATGRTLLAAAQTIIELGDQFAARDNMVPDDAWWSDSAEWNPIPVLDLRNPRQPAQQQQQQPPLPPVPALPAPLPLLPPPPSPPPQLVEQPVVLENAVDQYEYPPVPYGSSSPPRPSTPVDEEVLDRAPYPNFYYEKTFAPPSPEV